jgi:hypothetical protein
MANKFVSSKLFLVAFFFFSLVAFAGVIEKEVTFNRDDISFTEIKGYDFIKLEACRSTTRKIGAPCLPRAAFSVLIPPGAEITNVEIVSVDKEEISGEYEVYPTQHPQPFLRNKIFPFVEPDKDIYNQTILYPEKIIESPHTGSMGGYRLANVLIYPIQYKPSEKQLIFYSRIRFKVTYEEKLRSLITKTEKQNKIFRERVEKLILNPEDIRISEPSIGLSGTLALPPDTVEYVIITADSFAASFQELADWKTKKGIPAKVITLDSIYANYTGVDNAEKVRNFIIDANSTWGTIWVLLGGQCDYEWGQEIVPRRNVWYRDAIVGHYPDEDTIPSDLYFSDLDGDWNADGDGIYGESTDDVDLYSDVFVGRAPVRTVSQVEIFVNKVLTYEKRPPLGYQKKILLPAAILWYDYDEKLSQEAIASIVPGDWQVSRMYERDGDLTEAAFVDSVQSGFGFAHLVGHGNEDGIYTYYADEYFDSDDLDALGNDSLLGIHNSIGCMCGAIDYIPYGDCFAEHYLTPSTGGSYSIMNSRYGYGDPPIMGPSENIDTCFYHEIFSESYPYHDHIGAAHAFSKDGYISEVTWYSTWAWCIYELNLFGDPEMPLWTDEPGELTVTHDAVIPVGGSSFSVNVTDSGLGVENALVCLYKEGEVYQRGYTDASGILTLTLSPPPNSLGTMYCTVTKSNYIPYEGTVDVISPDGPWVIFEQYSIIDVSGNNDGNVDPGESIELPLTVHNVGLGDAESVTGLLRTEDAYVTITDSVEDFGDISADSLAISVEDFDFDVLPGCPANHVINFELVTSDINDSTWSSFFSVPILTPAIKIFPDTLDFDTVYIGFPDTLELLVHNGGGDTLFVSNITSNNSEFSTDITYFSVPPIETQPVRVIFAPVSEVMSTGNLTIESNDLDDSLLTVFLQGEGLLPPDISVSPDSLSDSLFTGETSTHTLTIYNNGSSDLNFDILIEELDTSMALVDFFADKSVRKHKVVAFGKPVPLNELKNKDFSFFPQSTEVSEDLIDKGKPFKNNHSNIKTLGLGEEVFGNDDNEFLSGPRTRGNLFTCEKSTTLIEHRLYINPISSTQLWFLVYEGESQVGIYNLISASDVTPAGPGLGWYSSGEVNVPLEEGKYYLIVASFEELSYYYNQQDISPYPIPASFGELTGGAGWNWAPTTNFPPATTQNVTADAFGYPVAYYQTLVTRRWLDCDTTEGSISAGDSVLIEVTFDAVGLNGGDYFADIIIASNDPDESEVIVPAHLHVTGVPDITVSADTIDFGTVYTGYSSTDTLIISNEGTDVLTVSYISIDNSDYSVDTSNFTVNPGETQAVAVTCTPSAVGTITGNLTIASNDPDESTVSVFLQAEGLAPPDISVSPDSLSDSLLTGEISFDTLTIYNTGLSDLIFDISVVESSEISVSKRAQLTSGINNSENKLLNKNWSSVNHSGPIHPNESSVFQKTINNVFPDILPQIKNLIVGGEVLIIGDGGTEITLEAILTAAGYTVTIVDDDAIYDGTNPGPELFDLVILLDGPDYGDDMPANGQTALVNYVQNGGGFMVTEWIAWEISMGRYQSMTDIIPLTRSGGYSGFDTYAVVESHPITEGVSSSFEIETGGNIGAANSGTVLVQGSTTGDAVVIKEFGSGRIVEFSSAGNYEGLDPFSNPDMQLLFINAVRWTSKSLDWLELNPLSDTIPAGDSVQIEVTFDATGLYGGEYYADIIVRSNDPDESELVVPTHLHVTGAPDIAVSADTLDFGIAFNGYSSTDTLIVYNEGSDSLTVSNILSDNPDYTVNTTNFILYPEEIQEVVVTFTPSTVGITTGNLTIFSDDPDEPNVIVFLQGECVEPPDISVSPDSLSDTLFTGETSTHTLTIYNTGGSDLNFVISIEGEGSTYALEFDGVDDYVEVPDNPSLSAIGVAFSLEFWMMVGEYPFQRREILGKWGSGSGVDDEYGGNIHTSGEIELNISGASGGLSRVYSNPISPHTWIHAAEVFDSASHSYKLFIDGILESNITPSTLTMNRNTSQPFRIGTYDFSYAPEFKGQMDEIRIWNVARTEEEIQANMYRELSGTEPGLIGYWKFDEGSGDTAYDSSPNNNDGMLYGGATWVVSSSPIVTWIYVDTTSGTVPVIDSMIVEVTFDATGLYGGDYYANIIVSSNDPDEPELVVPAHLHVTGAPAIAVSADTLDCGIVYPGSSVTDTLIVANEGTDTLIVSEISSDNGDFTIDTTNFVLGPEQNQPVLVTFTPSSMGIITGLLTIESNDPDDSTLTIYMKGECVEPPDISVSPDSLSDTLNQGESSIHTLTIYNTGVSDLIFAITEEAAEGGGFNLSSKKIPIAPTHIGRNADKRSQVSSLNKHMEYSTEESMKGIIQYRVNQNATGHLQPLAGTYTGDHLNFGLSDYGEIMPFQYPVGTEHLQVGSYLSGYTVCYNNGADHVAYTGYESRNGIVPVSYTEVVNDVEEAVIDVVTQTSGGELTITQRFTFDKQDKFIRIKTNIENTSGGTLNGIVFKKWADWDMDDDYEDDNWDYDSTHNMIYAWDIHHGTIAGETPPDYRDIYGWDDYDRRLTNEDYPNGPITYFDGLEILHYELGSLSPGEEEVLNFAYGAADDLSELQEVIERAIVGGVNWLSEYPDTGTVSANDSVKIEVTFDATGLNEGDYYADIVITSNDPDEPEVRVPAHLHVPAAEIEEKKIPKIFFVYQNYPNPFSSQTVIRYGCPEKTKVCIQVFDITGRIVNTLLDKEVEAGYHEVNWDGSNKFGKKLANAVYFYRMQTDKDFMATKKMIILR